MAGEANVSVGSCEVLDGIYIGISGLYGSGGEYA